MDAEQKNKDDVLKSYKELNANTKQAGIGGIGQTPYSCCCPSCGRCPTCGRPYGYYPYQPYNLYNPPQPWR